jgi:coenzyme F420-dependent glucose-6-phosphate dehydrogenase
MVRQIGDEDMPRYGWKAGIEQYAPQELLDFALMAEEAGFDSIDVSDHFHPWSNEGQAAFTWAWLGAVATRTSRIELGTGVTCPILRYHPSVIAQAAATIGALAPGRFYLGVGTGEALNEYAATGFWPDYDKRHARLEEAIKLIRLLWEGHPVTFDGIYYHTREARIYTLPEKEIPLFVSTLVPESASFAGKEGDGLFTTGGQQPEIYRQILQNFASGARESGKNPSQLRRAIELNVAYTGDTNSAVKSFKQYWGGTFIPALFDQRIYTPTMSAKNGEVVGTDSILQRSCISADPDKHVAFIQQYIDLGFDTIYLHSAGPDQRAFIGGYGRDVLPRLRVATLT